MTELEQLERMPYREFVELRLWLERLRRSLGLDANLEPVRTLTGEMRKYTKWGVDTHCAGAGHSLTPDNVITVGAAKKCRQCHYKNNRMWKQARAA